MRTGLITEVPGGGSVGSPEYPIQISHPVSKAGSKAGTDPIIVWQLISAASWEVDQLVLVPATFPETGEIIFLLVLKLNLCW